MESEIEIAVPRPTRYSAQYHRDQQNIWNIARVLTIAVAALALMYKLSPSDMTQCFLFASLLLLPGTGFAALVSFFTAQDRRDLLAQGTPVEGYVLEQCAVTLESNPGWKLRYGYALPDGRTFEVDMAFPKEYWEAHPRGASLTILYDPKDPYRHMPYVLIKQVEIDPERMRQPI